jgi:SWIM zinc finger
MPLEAYNDDMENLLVEHLQEREPEAPAGHDHRAYGLAAEVRAVEEGHNARVLPDGSVLVKAESAPGSYRVTVRAVDDGILRLGCTCRSGEYRRALPVPCKHAALAARRLEREGIARWDDGRWRLRDRAQARGARLLLAGTVRRAA